jgi:hypothetical protein
MRPREFWWLYEWKTRGNKGKKKVPPLTTGDVRRLRDMMDRANDAARIKGKDRG